MAASIIPALSDKDKYPSDDLIFSIIGERRQVWEKTLNYLQQNYPGSTSEWRYYNDGKQWLFKGNYKKKTIFWASILSDTFRITFYLGGKAESLVTCSTLSENLKKEFLGKELKGPFRAVTINVEGTSDLDDILKLIDLKIRQK